MVNAVLPRWRDRRAIGVRRKHAEMVDVRREEAQLLQRPAQLHRRRGRARRRIGMQEGQHLGPRHGGGVVASSSSGLWQ